MSPDQVHLPVEVGPNYFQKYTRTTRFAVEEETGRRSWRETNSILYAAVLGEDCGIGEHRSSQAVDPNGELVISDSVERWFFRSSRLYANLQSGRCIMDPVEAGSLPVYLPVLSFPLGFKLQRDEAGTAIVQVPSDRITIESLKPPGTAIRAVSGEGIAEGTLLMSVPAKSLPDKTPTASMDSLWQRIGTAGPYYCMGHWESLQSANHGSVRRPVRLTSFLRFQGETPALIESITYEFPRSVDYSQAEIDELVRDRDMGVIYSIDVYRLVESRPAVAHDYLRLSQVADSVNVVVPPGAPDAEGLRVCEDRKPGHPPKFNHRFDDESLSWEPIH